MRVGTVFTRPAALVLQGAAVLALLGTGSAWAVTAKTVTVSVDGTLRTVSTHGGSVADVLSAAHLNIGVHDLLAPSPRSSVQDGSRIVLSTVGSCRSRSTAPRAPCG